MNSSRPNAAGAGMAPPKPAERAGPDGGGPRGSGDEPPKKPTVKSRARGRRRGRRDAGQDHFPGCRGVPRGGTAGLRQDDVPDRGGLEARVLGSEADGAAHEGGGSGDRRAGTAHLVLWKWPASGVGGPPDSSAGPPWWPWEGHYRGVMVTGQPRAPGHPGQAVGCVGHPGRFWHQGGTHHDLPPGRRRPPSADAVTAGHGVETLGAARGSPIQCRKL